MPDDTRKPRLSRMLNPRNIVFVGDSRAAAAIEYNRRLGFAGDCLVIDPAREQFRGLTCYPSTRDLPVPTDLAFVAVPAEAMADTLRDLARAGVGAAVLDGRGLIETGDAGGQKRARLHEAAGSMPLLGPSSTGFVNFLDRVACMSGDLGGSPTTSGVAVIANGSAYLADIALSERSLPLAFLAGLDSRSDLGPTELLDLLLDDARVTAVNLYLEGIRDVRRLSECALKAQQQGIPVVVLQAGRSKAGSDAAQIHGVSIAEDARFASALFERLGFIEVHSAGEALETLKMLSLAPAPRGSRVALIARSGSHAVIASDLAAQQDLELPPVSETTRAELRSLLPESVPAANPLGIAGFELDPEQLQRIFETLLGDDYDIALQCLSFSAAETPENETGYRTARCLAAAAREAGLPAALVAPTHEGLPRAARETLIEAGIVPLQGFEHGLRAIAHALDWQRRRENLAAQNLLLPDAPPIDAELPTPLDEFESKLLLAELGVPVPSGWRWRHGEEVPNDLRYPVVLKLCDASILHKAELGAVSLNLASVELLRFAREQIRTNLRRQNILVESFLVEEAVHGGLAELRVRVRRIAHIGYSLTLAMGETEVERRRDSVNLLLPCDRDAIGAALRRLGGYARLNGSLSGVETDIGAALDVIEAIVDGVIARGDIVELDITPLIVRADGLGVAAADALVQLQGR